MIPLCNSEQAIDRAIEIFALINGMTVERVHELYYVAGRTENDKTDEFFLFRRKGELRQSNG